LMVNWIWFCPI